LKTICSGIKQAFSRTRLEPVWGRTGYYTKILTVKD